MHMQFIYMVHYMLSPGVCFFHTLVSVEMVMLY